jgi:hypothetical protein
LDLNFKVDVLFESGFDLVWSQLSETLLQEMNFELYVEVFLLEVINVLYEMRLSISARVIRDESGHRPSPGLEG